MWARLEVVEVFPHGTCVARLPPTLTSRPSQGQLASPGIVCTRTGTQPGRIGTRKLVISQLHLESKTCARHHQPSRQDQIDGVQISDLPLVRWGSAKVNQWSENHRVGLDANVVLLAPCPCQVKRADRFRLTRRGATHSRDLSGRGTARAEDAQGTPTQSHISPSIQVYE